MGQPGGAGIGDKDTSPRDQAQGPAVMVPTGAAPSHALGREAIIINQNSERRGFHSNLSA